MYSLTQAKPKQVTHSTYFFGFYPYFAPVLLFQRERERREREKKIVYFAMISIKRGKTKNTFPNGDVLFYVEF